MTDPITRKAKTIAIKIVVADVNLRPQFGQDPERRLICWPQSGHRFRDISRNLAVCLVGGKP